MPARFFAQKLPTSWFASCQISQPNEWDVLSTVFRRYPDFGLCLFKGPHTIGRTETNGSLEPFGSRIDAQQRRNPSQLPLRMGEQILVTHYPISVPSLTQTKPAEGMVFPRSDLISRRPSLVSEKEIHKVVFWKTIGDGADFQAIVIHRNGNISSVPHEVYDAWISRIEAFVALNQARTGTQLAVRVFIDGWHEIADVFKIDSLISVDKITNQKARPSGAGTHISD